MTDTTLFSPVTLGALSLPNRIVMSPMTRARTTQPGNIPNAMMAKYYAQRASAGLIITEATQISPSSQGYSFTPGVHSKEQIAGWKLVTDAVHAKGGRIFCQIWHVGRLSHSMFHEDGQTMAPSAIAPQARIWVSIDGEGQMLDCPVPRALEVDEIQNIVQDFAQAAANAIEAGFDGVELHGANGYLIDQFLRTTANERVDQYGGSRTNRLRFLNEVASAVADRIGANKVGLRLAPFITARNMACPDILPTIIDAAKDMQALGLAYIHLAEADWDDAPVVTEAFRVELREAYQGAIIVAGNYTPERASALLSQNLIDLVAFGRHFIANPDFVARVNQSLPLAPIGDMNTLFGGNEVGYSDYPNYQAV